MRPLWFFLLIFLCENVILWLIFVPLSTIQHSEPECVQIDSRQGCFAKVTNQTVLGELKMREKEGEKTSESLTERISLEKNVSSDKNVSLVAMVKVFRRFDCAAATVASLRAAGIDSVWLLCDGGAADTCPNGTALVTPFDVGAAAGRQRLVRAVAAAGHSWVVVSDDDFLWTKSTVKSLRRLASQLPADVVAVDRCEGFGWCRGHWTFRRNFRQSNSSLHLLRHVTPFTDRHGGCQRTEGIHQAFAARVSALTSSGWDGALKSNDHYDWLLTAKEAQLRVWFCPHLRVTHVPHLCPAGESYATRRVFRWRAMFPYVQRKWHFDTLVDEGGLHVTTRHGQVVLWDPPAEPVTDVTGVADVVSALHRLLRSAGGGRWGSGGEWGEWGSVWRKDYGACDVYHSVSLQFPDFSRRIDWVRSERECQWRWDYWTVLGWQPRRSETIFIVVNPLKSSDWCHWADGNHQRLWLVGTKEENSCDNVPAARSLWRGITGLLQEDFDPFTLVLFVDGSVNLFNMEELSRNVSRQIICGTSVAAPLATKGGNGLVGMCMLDLNQLEGSFRQQGLPSSAWAETIAKGVKERIIARDSQVFYQTTLHAPIRLKSIKSSLEGDEWAESVPLPPDSKEALMVKSYCGGHNCSTTSDLSVSFSLTGEKRLGHYFIVGWVGGTEMVGIIRNRISSYFVELE